MAKGSKNNASKSQEDALKIAKATQRPGQTKEQTKLIAKGVQKGIEEYKKQQKEKARELDKNLKKAKRTVNNTPDPEVVVEKEVQYRQSILPWGLLALSWAGFAVYIWQTLSS